VVICEERGGLAVTEIVSCVVALPLAARVTVVGLALQKREPVAPEHSNPTCPVYPFWLEMFTLNIPSFPTLIVAAVGETKPVIPPTMNCPATVWDVCAAAPVTANEYAPCGKVAGIDKTSVTLAGNPF